MRKTHNTNTMTESASHGRVWSSAAYAAAMGNCGIVLVALGACLPDLAQRLPATAVGLGTVFVARGAGAIVGALSSGWLYAPPRSGHAIMSGTLVFLAACLAGIPLVRKVWLLHCFFFVLGLCTATLDTGCQIMTRALHGPAAGPYLGANTVAHPRPSGNLVRRPRLCSVRKDVAVGGGSRQRRGCDVDIPEDGSPTTRGHAAIF